MTRFNTLIFLIALTFAGCTGVNPELRSGEWRGEFTVEGNKKIPFNFSVEGGKPALPKVFLLNGEERAELDAAYINSDSVVIPVNIYDAVLIAKVDADSLHGYFRKNQSGKQGLRFDAARNQNFRFNVGNEGVANSVGGKWSVNLISEKDGKTSTRYTVGLLEQKGNKVTGTILTTTGDYRYLEGVIDGTQLRLSAFSGSSPTLIEAQLVDSLHLTGEFISPTGKTILQAIKSDTAALPDPYTLTFLKPGFDRLSFSFPNLQGEPVSLKDKKYEGKVVVLTVLGSWCPNCVDEAAFLAPWYKENKDRGIEIVGLSFERKDDFEFAKARLSTLIKKFDIQYDILFAGVSDKKIVAQKLPELNTFLSFPTTLFIDKQGKVRKVHTGYSGPATGQYYEAYVREFNDEVNTLVNEPAEEKFKLVASKP
ncbi:MAG TPA: TlpA disulfide reductase family protein [Cyclobacteriaceae bacterium]|nr:TlpA disulfide reductase family protein [Cyclobacteriaceae bacterium]